MGKLTNLNPPTALTDGDIPNSIARDNEVTAVMNGHLAAIDPHTQYLLESEGDARYRRSSVALTDGDIPNSIARDNEVTAVMNGHLAAIDPHTQYLLESEGDARYRQSSVAIFTSVPFPAASAAGNSIALSWNSVQAGLGIAEICNFAGLGGGDTLNIFRKPGNSTTTPGLSDRVARVDISGAYIQTSDERLKSHFSPAPGLEAIMGLRPLRYTHWSCNGFDEETQTLKVGKFFTRKIGFLAQEVRAIVPEAVPQITCKEEPFGIDYSCLLACVVQAIQQMNGLLQQQQEQINELQSQLKNLKLGVP
jgi:hypothetical protein